MSLENKIETLPPTSNHLSETWIAKYIIKYLPIDNQNRIIAHLFYGYLSALFEWRAIDIDTYDRLTNLIYPFNNLAATEIFGSRKIPDNEIEEINRHLEKKREDWSQEAHGSRSIYCQVNLNYKDQVISYYSYERMRPTVKEISKRIQLQLSWRGMKNDIFLVWKGYIVALFNIHLIDHIIYDELIQLIPSSLGQKELNDIFLSDGPKYQLIHN